MSGIASLSNTARDMFRGPRGVAGFIPHLKDGGEADKWTGPSPFDPKKDKPIQLPGGSNATEYTATIEMDGKFVNVPQIWFQNGKPMFFDAETGWRSLFTMVKSYEAGTNKLFPRFNTVAEAEAAAIERSTAGGATKSFLAKDQ